MKIRKENDEPSQGRVWLGPNPDSNTKLVVELLRSLYILNEDI